MRERKTWMPRRALCLVCVFFCVFSCGVGVRERERKRGVPHKRDSWLFLLRFELSCVVSFSVLFHGWYNHGFRGWRWWCNSTAHGIHDGRRRWWYHNRILRCVSKDNGCHGCGTIEKGRIEIDFPQDQQPNSQPCTRFQNLLVPMRHTKKKSERASEREKEPTSTNTQHTNVSVVFFSFFVFFPIVDVP